ncbi:hypothetical protein MT325_m640L [Paramecium bursaria chlorella virus MT325]|uniref:Uncharacterized protein m640L n=1 Tax=Paramecium bursaria Chlorella virus MT325 TaxID=346932 RepID=A7IV20_PBCVM|nr:hypothetical protein MT325_m640L [Paramecium bursaria chlorella virus MT325]
MDPGGNCSIPGIVFGVAGLYPGGTGGVTFEMSSGNIQGIIFSYISTSGLTPSGNSDGEIVSLQYVYLNGLEVMSDFSRVFTFLLSTFVSERTLVTMSGILENFFFVVSMRVVISWEEAAAAAVPFIHIMVAYGAVGRVFTSIDAIRFVRSAIDSPGTPMG